MRKPWFWKARKSWFVNTIDGRVDLGADQEKAHEKWAVMLAMEQRRDN